MCLNDTLLNVGGALSGLKVASDIDNPGLEEVSPNESLSVPGDTGLPTDIDGFIFELV